MNSYAIADLDQTAIELIRSGDHAAFASLVESYQRPVYNLCYRLLGNTSEAEEATQETFLRAYAKRSSHDPSRPMRTWLFSIAHHYCIDRLRRRRLTWLSLEDEPEPDAVSWRGDAPSPEDAALARERANYLQALVSSLPSRNREVLVLRYWCDLSYDEIAQTTGTTVSAVKSRLHRARTQLGDLVVLAEKGMNRSLRSVRVAAVEPAIHPV